MSDRRWFCRVEWKPQDCWIGVFWKSQEDDVRWRGRGSTGRWVRTRSTFDCWVCLVPMVPIHFGWKRAGMGSRP